MAKYCAAAYEVKQLDATLCKIIRCHTVSDPQSRIFPKHSPCAKLFSTSHRLLGQIWPATFALPHDLAWKPLPCVFVRSGLLVLFDQPTRHPAPQAWCPLEASSLGPGQHGVGSGATC